MPDTATDLRIDVILLTEELDQADALISRLATQLQGSHALSTITRAPVGNGQSYIELSKYQPGSIEVGVPGYGAALRFIAAASASASERAVGREVVKLIDETRAILPCLALDFITLLAAPPEQPLPLARVLEFPEGYQTRGLIKLGLPELLADHADLTRASCSLYIPDAIEELVRMLIERPGLMHDSSITTTQADFRLVGMQYGSQDCLRLRLQPTVKRQREAYFHVESG